MKVTFQSLLDEKKPFLGIFVQSGAPEFVEAMGYAGFRYAVLDLEHTYYGVEKAAEMIRAGEAAGLCMLVRVPAMDSIWIKKSLDFGASGIIVPNIDTPEDAADMVRRCMYTPEGYRGACPGTRAFEYGKKGGENYAASNRDVAVIPLIESRRGVKNFPEIVRTPGITSIFLGPVDLSVDMGLCGNIDDPSVQTALLDMIHESNAAGVPVGALTLDPAFTKHLFREGMDFCGYGIDNIIMYRALKEIHDSVIV